MPDSSQRFIAAATAPLADNAELQMIAYRELEGMIDAAGSPPNDPAFLAATEGLNRGRRSPHWRMALFLSACLLTALAFIPIVRDYFRLQVASYYLFSMSDPLALNLPGFRWSEPSPTAVPGLFGDLSPSQRLLLFGGPTKTGPGEPAKALWQSSPDDPALFANYLRAIGRNHPIPADALASADRIDLGNAWYRHLASAALAREAVTHSNGYSTQGLSVSNPAQLAKAIRLLEEAALQPRYESHFDDLLLRRLEILPPGDDFLSRSFATAYFDMAIAKDLGIDRDVHLAVAARARELAANGDTTSFTRMIGAWENILRRSIENRTPAGQLSTLEDVAGEVAVAAKTLGLGEIADRYVDLKKALVRDDIERSARYCQSYQDRVATGILANRTLWSADGLRHPPPVTAADLKPGKLAERALATRLFALGFWACFAIALLLLAPLPFRHGMQVRRLSSSLLRVLRGSDYSWIFVAGVLAPLALHQCIEHLSPLQDQGFPMQMPDVNRNAGTAALMLLLPYLIASRRLRKRLPFLGRRRSLVPEVAACALALILWFTGFLTGLFGIEIDSAMQAGLNLFLAALGIGLLVHLLSAFMARRDRAVETLTLNRAVLPAYGFAALLAAVAMLLAHAAERYWIHRDILTMPQAGIPASTRYEHEADKQARVEMLEILDNKR